jgi:hypothetical protein
VFAAPERIEAVLADCTAGLAGLKPLASGRVTVGVVSTASKLRDFLVAEGRRFLPNIKLGRRGGKTPAARGKHSAKRK